jgi:hypothetical protein
MTLVAIFLTVFVAGPLIFRFLTLPKATVTQSRRMAVLALICAIAALILRYGLPAHIASDPSMILASVLLIWLGWISILAFGALALRRADPGLSMRRMSAVLGAAGTTNPWFGLVWASQTLS